MPLSLYIYRHSELDSHSDDEKMLTSDNLNVSGFLFFRRERR